MDRVVDAADIGLTVGAFAFGRWLSRRTGRHPLANPTLVAILVVVGALLASGQNYSRYMRGGWMIGWLLGPATVALGIPLAHNARSIGRDVWPVGLAVLAGAVAAAVSAAVSMRVLGGSQALALSMAPKAVTTPIAMGIAAQVGGVPVLAAIFAIIGGVVVAVLSGSVMRVMRVEDHRVFGLAAGVAGSGIGAAQAVDRHPDAGAYAAVGVGVNSVVTAVLVPMLAGWHVF